MQDRYEAMTVVRVVAVALCMLVMFVDSKRIGAEERSDPGLTNVDDFRLLPRGGEVPDCTSNVVRCWTLVPPGWIVGVVDAIPERADIPHNPFTFPLARYRPRTLGIVSVNAATSRCRWLRFTDEMVWVAAVFAAGPDECGIVLGEHSRPQADGQLMTWNLVSDKIVRRGKWPSEKTPIAEQLDLAKATLEIAETGERNDFTSTVRIGEAGHRKFVEVPVVRREYRLPMFLSSFWEAEHDSRWYCRWDGVAILHFHGRRPWEGSTWNVPYRSDSTLTLFDPRCEGGVRWKRTLSELGIVPRNGLFPIATPWEWNGEALLESVDVSSYVRPAPVSIYRVSADGRADERSFKADEEFDIRGRWPQCTTDMKRVVYLVGENEPRLRVFDFESGTFCAELKCPRFAHRILTVLPNDEAVVTDEGSLWGVDLSPQSDGKPRLIADLFRK